MCIYRVSRHLGRYVWCLQHVVEIRYISPELPQPMVVPRSEESCFRLVSFCRNRRYIRNLGQIINHGVTALNACVHVLPETARCIYRLHLEALHLVEKVVRSLVTAYVDIIATQVAEEHKLVVAAVIVTPLQGIVRAYKGLVYLRLGLVVVFQHIGGG